MRLPMTRHFKKFAPLAATALLFSVFQMASPVAADTAPADPNDPKTPITAAADPLPTVQIDGVAWVQKVVGNTVYVGGSFATARPAGAAPGTNTTPRANLLAYDIRTGNLISSWAPTTNGEVNSITVSPDGQKIYIGGNFTTVNGVARSRIAALNPTTGATINSFQARSDAKVRAIVATADTVYFGGLTTNVNGTARSRVAAVTAATGALLTWAPTAANGSVHALAISPDGSQIIIGGSFTTLNGSSNPGYGLASVDPVTGALLPFEANTTVRNGGPDAAITALTTDGDSLYASGFVFGQGGRLEGVARISWNGGAVNWVEDCHGDTYGTYPKGDVIYVASHSHYCGNLPDGFPQTEPWTQHYGTAYTKAVTGTLTADPLGYANWAGTPSPSLLKWLPLLLNGTYTGQGQAGWNIVGNDQYIAIGGEFPSAGKIPQQGLVRYAMPSIAPNKIGPEFNQSKFNPTVTSFARGTARISWKANWDRDNENLTYQVIRNGITGAPVYTKTLASSEWNRPSMGYLDTGLTPGATYRYRVFAKDPFGNEVRSDTVNVVVSESGEISPYAQGVLDDGASSYWRLGEDSGTAVIDWAGFSDAVAQPGVSRGIAGAIGADPNNASGFDGTANGSAYGNQSQTAPDTFTAESWFKTTSDRGGKILGFGNAQTGNSSNYDRQVYMGNNGQINFGVHPGGVRLVTSPLSYNDGNWHHVAATLGSGGMELYVDGRRVANRTDVTSGQGYSGQWRIGGDNLNGWPNRPSSDYFSGAIDDTAIYPTALSAAKVRGHFTASGRTFPGSTAPADSYGKAVYDNDPDLFWRLSESSGTTAADSSPNDANATYDGGTVLGEASGVGVAADRSAMFDGSNDAVASNNTYVNPTTYSEELWFKTTSTRGGKLIGFGSSKFGGSSSYDRHVYMFNDGRLRFGTYTGQTNVIDSPASYNDGNWHHMVATQGSGGMKLYVDSALVGTNPQTSAQSYTGFWRVGGDTHWGGADSNYFAGTIDEVAVYSKALGSSDISDHFLKGGGQLPNAKPTAAYTYDVDQLKVAFDGTGSTDTDGTVDSYAWDFGDGDVSTASKPDHTFTTGGNHTVTLTVTDNDGGTDTITKTVTTAEPPAGPVASDDFGRTESDGWGSAGVGGAWTRGGSASLFSVAGGVATMRLATPGSGPKMSLNDVSSADSDVKVKFALDKAATGGGTFVSVLGRSVGTADYRTKVKVASTGVVTVYLVRVAGGVETTLQSVNLPSTVRYAAGEQFQIRMQVVGTSPTSLKAKVWEIGSAEPAGWQVSTTDSTGGLQAAGGLALTAFLSGTATNAPVIVSFDDLLVEKTAGP